MSVASDRLAAAKSRMDEISREHADRRELRERHSREARDKAGASLDKQAAVAEKTIERIQEAGKRQKAAGGWGTAAATEKKSGEFRFGSEDDEPTYEAQAPGTGWAAGPPTATPPPPQPPVTPPPPPPAVPSPPPVRPAPRRRAPVDDDDDFGGQSWLT
ncbi:hypothetical protein ABZ816_21280 [Actinosynnema sp. NPDC047251]|uniref:Uncharacterized protein n=1 Tax=Saccharothrix espanaensis (strain ATCC 51144 / DSM 44229 / JCM 9112 / NBRC 15066 / NRRL 15764) TaxID=1179773 RepID=K0KEC6_SACES|nr:hypothetical protein [Saccharothrix espanaensis]CCH35099.1 hypothetical protein BN6_78810 [Saccharothrix espanaensis DSM 44229]